MQNLNTHVDQSRSFTSVHVLVQVIQALVELLQADVPTFKNQANPSKCKLSGNKMQNAI